jgi:RNA polymerase sigma-70 factor (ECF subfamily)
MLYEFDHQHLTPFSASQAAISKNGGDPSDEELMERIQARDETALETLMRRYQAMLRSVIGRMIANDQDVSDVLEEVFLGVWNQASNFDTQKGKAVGWIITMARRRAIDRVRRCQAYDRAEKRFRLATDTGNSNLALDDVEEHAANADCAGIFHELLAALPEAQRQVVKMAFYRGLSQREIARETGIPLGTIKTRLELGVKKLRSAVCAMGSREDWLLSAA